MNNYNYLDALNANLYPWKNKSETSDRLSSPTLLVLGPPGPALGVICLVAGPFQHLRDFFV